MARATTKLLSGVSATGASSAIVPECEREPYGVLKVMKSGAVTSFTLALEGRMSPTESWYTIGTLTQANLDANGSAALQAMLFTEVRANLTAFVGGGGTLSVWLME